VAQSLKVDVSYSNEEGKMKAYWKGVSCAAIAIIASLGISDLWAQQSAVEPSVLHMEQSKTTSEPGFPTFLGMYHVLDGAKSPAEALSLTGTISLKNFDPKFSEVLWALAYWQGECPAHDLSLSKATAIIWTDILKNPSQSDSTLTVNLDFPHPLPMTGCLGLYYGGGALDQKGGKVTMSADLDLTYRPLETANPNMVIGVGGEYCFGQNGGCQNATAIDGEGFAVPIPLLQPGHLVELYGNISDSTFDGTNDNGPLPTGESWGAVNDFYLLPRGCGIFAQNLNSEGFPNPAPLSTLRAWLPHDALHLGSVPLVDRTLPGETTKAPLQSQAQNIFSVPIKVNAGDCMLVIYGRTGNGATDNETQVNALITP
jgi:hypothetical protein